jgi:hypothetical protein
MNNKLKKYGRKLSCPDLMYHPEIHLEVLRISTKNLNWCRQSPGPDMKFSASPIRS